MPDTFTTLTESEFAHRTVENPAGVKATVLANGCLQTLEVGPTMVNLFVGSPLVGSATRLYLRRISEEDRLEEWIELVGPSSQAEVLSTPCGFVWSKVWNGLRVRAELVLHQRETAWGWRVSLAAEGNLKTTGRFDAVLVQDVGIASRGQVQNNEAYTSQYIDHQIFDHDSLGPVIVSRQNLAQDGQHPWVIHACTNGASNAITDAYDFFGPSSRSGAAPIGLGPLCPKIRNRQGEASCHVLRSRAVELTADDVVKEISFVTAFDADHASPSSRDDLARLEPLVDRRKWSYLDQTEVITDRPAKWLIAPPLDSKTLLPDELDRYWPGERRHVEKIDGELASFFSDQHRHVVFKGKELSADRRTAHLLVAGDERLPGGDTLCSTGYASGPIASHICLGNTSFNKLASVSRDPLNLIRSDGLRLYVRLDDGQPWRPLGTASAFDMGRDDCRWYYNLQDGPAFTVTATAQHDGPALHYEFQSPDTPLQIMAVTHLVLGDKEHEHPATVEIDGRTATLTAAKETMVRSAYPEASWTVAFDENTAAVGGDELLWDDGQRRRLPHLVARSGSTKNWGWTITGTLGPVAAGQDQLDDRVTADTKAAVPTLQHADAPGVGRLAEALPWFDHNASIHLTAPHGIEQYGGAAWGVRDVCQGPVEWLLARGEFETVGRILEDVFSHQYDPDSAGEGSGGAWPQWYMHAPFANIQSPHSHGDVAVWPIIAAVNYLTATEDTAWLDRVVPFTQSEAPFALTEKTATIREHIELAIEKLIEKFVPGTSLLSYGDGDWNDSLQPARPEMRESMVSTWTVELFYQALRGWSQVMRQLDDNDAATKHDATADAIRVDFERLLVVDNETAGLYMHDADPEKSRLLLHPRDTETGVKHRLLPMIRGIISEIFTPEQANHHAELIDAHLLAPDGARLMDRPPQYTGGTSTHFQRLESASFFGREIGLMYTHAHLRYAEAMAKLGEADLLFEALQKVNPVGIEHAVPNANPRQANCYFSSSDAAFLNRDDSEKRYDELMQGDVPVNGGWRVYSSGPGIYLGLIVRQWLGLRRAFDRFVFDPVLSPEHDGLVASVSVMGLPCTVAFRVSGGAAGVEKVTLDGVAIESCGREDNPYRVGGWCVDAAELKAKLRDSEAWLEVFS